MDTYEGARFGSSMRARRVLTTLGIVLVGLVLTWVAYRVNHDHAQAQAEERSHNVVGSAVGDLQNRVDRTAEVVDSVASFMSSTPRVTREHFDAFVDPALAEHPELQRLLYTEIVTEADRAAFEQQLAAEGYPAGITKLETTGERVPAPARDTHLVVTFLRPDGQPVSFVGTDALLDPDAADYWPVVFESGELTVSDPFPVKDRPTVAALMSRAVYDSAEPTDTREHRLAAVQGVVTGSLIYPVLLQESLATAAHEMDVAVFDSFDGQRTAVLAAVDGEFSNYEGAPGAIQNLDLESPAAVQGDVRVGDRTIQVLVIPTAAAMDAFERPANWIIVVLGLLVTALVAVLQWRWAWGRRHERLAAALRSANEELKEHEVDLRRMAQTDALTGLLNRAAMRRLVESLSEDSDTYTFALVDLDGFKFINDSVGHRQGDRLLTFVAKRILSRVGEGTTVARTGGDEFALLIPCGHAEAEQQIDSVLDGLSAPFALGERIVHLRASAGWCSWPSEASGEDDIFVNADVAMHEAKRTDRGGSVRFDRSVADRAERREWLERALRHALDSDDGELAVHYQPKVDVRSGQVVGAEGLIRWTQPDEGMVSPSEFIPVAEETGLIVRLGDFVLHEVVGFIRRCMDAEVPIQSISLNLSGQQFLSGGLPGKVMAELDAVEVPASMLVMEVTETVAMEGDEIRILEQLNELRDLGVLLSIDDFGTGYSSMARLGELPVQRLKIDRAFVSALPDGHAQAGIVRAMLSIARHLGLEVVAEGVETEAQLGWLADAGCEEAQGWLFSPAVPPEQYLKYVQDQQARLTVRP